MMGRHQYITEDEYEVNLKDFEPQPGIHCCFSCTGDGNSVSNELYNDTRYLKKNKLVHSMRKSLHYLLTIYNTATLHGSWIA